MQINDKQIERIETICNALEKEIGDIAVSLSHLNARIRLIRDITSVIKTGDIYKGDK